MIVETDFWRKNFEYLTKEPYSYMVLNIRHMQDSDMLDKFELSLNIINTRNAFEMINQLWIDLGVEKKLDVSIFNSVTNLIYTEAPFTKEQLNHYFSIMKEFEEVVKAFRAFNATFESIYVEDEIEFLMLGVSLKKQKDNEDKINGCEGIADRYNSIKHDYYNVQIDYTTFLARVAKLLNEIK